MHIQCRASLHFTKQMTSWEQKKEYLRDRCECRIIMSRALALSYGDIESSRFAQGVKEKQMWRWPLHNVSKKERTEREYPIIRTQLKRPSTRLNLHDPNLDTTDQSSRVRLYISSQVPKRHKPSYYNTVRVLSIWIASSHSCWYHVRAITTFVISRVQKFMQKFNMSCVIHF
jgi:hypothetical protein